MSQIQRAKANGQHMAPAGAETDGTQTAANKIAPAPMSALGQKRTPALQKAMSALSDRKNGLVQTAMSAFPPKADMCDATWWDHFFFNVE
jgi:hypothetical protein